MRVSRPWAAVASQAAVSFAQDCQIATVGYENGGSYLVDAKASGNFQFAAMFSNQQCSSETAYTVTLSGPEGQYDQQYRCSDLRTSIIGSMQLSTCPIALEDIRSGQWTLDIRSPSGAGITRMFDLTVLGSTTTTITSTPTVIAGTTITPPPTTVTSTSVITRGVTLPIRTITSQCPVKTETTILRLPPTTTTSYTTSISTVNGGSSTRVITSYSTRSATCRIGGGPPGGVCPPLGEVSWFSLGAGEIPSWLIDCLSSSGITWSQWGKRTAMPLHARAVQAITETVTAPAVTRTTTATAPAQVRTTIRTDTITQTITRPATLVCDKTADETSTFTLPGETWTKIQIITSIFVSVRTTTSTVTQTTSSVDQAASRSCINRGGVYTWKP